jgi:hypothetical protein
VESGGGGGGGARGQGHRNGEMTNDKANGGTGLIPAGGRPIRCAGVTSYVQCTLHVGFCSLRSRMGT